MTRAVPESIGLAAVAAAQSLRERADAYRPDEDLAVSIASNASVGDEFARAYARLAELGLRDGVLDRFGLESATPSQMREAADLLERLAQSEVPRRKKRGVQYVKRSVARKQRVAAVLVAVLLGVPILCVGAAFVAGGGQTAKEWWLQRGAKPLEATASVATARGVIADAPPLAPVNQGYEAAVGGQVVPKKPRDYVTDRAGVLPGAAARSLNARLAQFERETSNQLLVFVDHSLPPGTTMEAMTVAAIRHWGVGQKREDNGAIFFVFLNDRRMRIEVGYGLESVLTDARSKRIYQAVEAVMQLRGQAGTNQVPDAKTALIQSLGGPASTAVSHILQRL